MAISINDLYLKETRATQTVRWFAANNTATLLIDGSASPASDYVQLQIRDEAGSTTLATLKPVALDSDDTASIDISSILNSLLSSDITAKSVPFGTATEAVGAYLRFKIYYRDDTGSYADLGNVYTAVQAVRQPGSNSELAEFVALASGSPFTLDASGAFLTDFDQPVLWYYDNDGTNEVFVPSLAFIVGENFAGNDFEVSGLGTAITGSALDEGIYYVSVATDVDLTQETLTATLTDTTSSIDMQSITLEVREACNNPKAIRWLNDLGGWDVWVFEGKAPYTLGTELASSYKKAFNSLGLNTGADRSYLINGRYSVALTAPHLTLNQAKQLGRMTQSTNIQMFMGELTDAVYNTWRTVTVQPGSFSVYDEYNSQHRVELTINVSEEINTAG